MIYCNGMRCLWMMSKWGLWSSTPSRTTHPLQAALPAAVRLLLALPGRWKSCHNSLKISSSKALHSFLHVHSPPPTFRYFASWDTDSRSPTEKHNATMVVQMADPRQVIH